MIYLNKMPDIIEILVELDRLAKAHPIRIEESAP